MGPAEGAVMPYQGGPPMASSSNRIPYFVLLTSICVFQLDNRLPPMGYPMRDGPMRDGPPLRDRISDRYLDEPPHKRPRRSLPAPAPLPPRGGREDPRAGRLASYTDLDSAAPAASLELELDY